MYVYVKKKHVFKKNNFRSIRVFMGPFSNYMGQDEYVCGLWVRDVGAFLKRIMVAIDTETAELAVNVKHGGQSIGTRGNNNNN